VGSITPASASTDNLGRVSATYVAPAVSAPTALTITASFSGDSKYAASSQGVFGTVMSQEMVQVVENLKENMNNTLENLGIATVENEDLQALENAYVNGNLGAVMTITIEAGKPGMAKGYERDNVKTTLSDWKAGEKIEVTVESTENGKTVVINIDDNVLPTGLIKRILIDNVEIGPADDYADVLDPTNDNGVAEYYILKGGRGAQILISIPHFSTRTITISTLPTQPLSTLPPVWIVGVSAFGLLIGTIAVIWTYTTRGRKRTVIIVHDEKRVTAVKAPPKKRPRKSEESEELTELKKYLEKETEAQEPEEKESKKHS
jgi:hypothetical protein